MIPQALLLAVLGVLALTSVTVEAFHSLPAGAINWGHLKGGTTNKIPWNHLKVKYDLPFSGRFSIPLSTSEVGKDYQLLQAHEEFPMVALYTYKGDPSVQLMYDDHGKICGMRVAHIKDHIEDRKPKGEKFPYSYAKKPIYKEGKAMDKEFYYIDVLFIHPDELKTGGPISRTEAVGTGVYIKMDGKTWTQMPRNEKEIVNTKFTEQGCILGMGKHYFYDITEDMRCEDLQPVFLLYHKYELIGLGLTSIGTFDKTLGPPWFEDPPHWIINTIIPRGPKCLAEWVKKYGTISLHIFFRHFNELNCFL